MIEFFINEFSNIHNSIKKFIIYLLLILKMLSIKKKVVFKESKSTGKLLKFPTIFVNFQNEFENIYIISLI